MEKNPQIYIQDNVRHTADLNLHIFAVLKLIVLPTVILSAPSTDVERKIFSVTDIRVILHKETDAFQMSKPIHCSERRRHISLCRDKGGTREQSRNSPQSCQKTPSRGKKDIYWKGKDIQDIHLVTKGWGSSKRHTPERHVLNEWLKSFFLSKQPVYIHTLQSMCPLLTGHKFLQP